jgi:hypothetical protein
MPISPVVTDHDGEPRGRVRRHEGPTVRGHLKEEISKLPATALSAVFVALMVALLVAPLRRWLLTDVRVDILVIVALGLAVVLLGAVIVSQAIRLRHRNQRIGDVQEVGRIDHLTRAYRKAEIQPAIEKKCEEAFARQRVSP